METTNSPALERESGLACVWAGDLTMPELEAYIDIEEDEEGDPSIPFGRDLGTFANHDFIAITAEDHPSTVPELLVRLRYDLANPTFYEAVARDVNPTSSFRCLIVYTNVAPNAEMFRREFAGGRLRFIGCWRIAK